MGIAEHDKQREINDYQDNVEKRIALVGEIAVAKGISSRKIGEIEEHFDNIISNIKEETQRIVADIEMRKSKRVQELTTQKEQLNVSIAEVQKKIKYLRKFRDVEGEPLGFKEKEIKPYRDTKILKMGVLYKDNYMLIKLFIIENDKPKNKFSLVAYGKTKLHDFLDLPYTYGTNVNDSYCGCNIKTIIKDMPTIDELKEYLKRNKNKILESFLGRYKVVVDEYCGCNNHYDLKDFNEVLKPKEVSETEVSTVCIVDRVEWLLYNDFYYSRAKKIDGDVFDYIKINNKLYLKKCRKELMSITQTGNTLFGNWWSMYVEESPYGRRVTPFNKENFEKELTEAKTMLGLKNKKRQEGDVSFRYPKEKWINPYLIRDVGSEI